MDAPFSDKARKYFDRLNRLKKQNKKKTYDELLIENDKLKKQLRIGVVSRSLPEEKEIVSELVKYFKKLQRDNPTLIVDLYTEAYKLGFKKAQKPSDNG